MTSLTVNEIRENGIGSNHKVLNPEDGYRKDNRLWFGECSECGERITSSLHNKGEWTHTIYKEQGFYSKEAFDKGFPYNFGSSYEVAYCPVAKGEQVDTVKWYQVDGVKYYA